MSNSTNKKAQAQKELASPVAPHEPALQVKAPRKRLNVPEIFRESVRVYFLPITATVQFIQKLARRTWLKKP